MKQIFQATPTLLDTSRSSDSTAIPDSTSTTPVGTLRAVSDLRTGSTSKPPRDGHTYRVLAYLRVSHSLQADNYTFETQLARIREKLDSFYGAGAYELEVHQDEGLSGGYGPTPTGVEKRTRASLLELHAKLQSGHYDGFIVYKLNRLFRSYRWLGQWIEDVLIPCSADIISATEDLDFNTSQGRALIMMISIFDASAREGMAERNCDAQRTRAESGYLLGPPPYGWKRQPRDQVAPGARPGIVPVEEHKEHVLFIMDRYLAGWGCTRIGADLNSRGIRHCKGGKWSPGSVMAVIHNPVHCGYIRTKRKGLIQGRHFEERFYDIEKYEQAQQTLKLRHKFGSTNTNRADSPHLVNGIATCARCGNRLYIYTGSSAYRAYRCKNGAYEGEWTCRKVTVRADWIEDAVEREIALLSELPEVRDVLLEEAAQLAAGQDDQLQQEHDGLWAAVRQIEEKEQRLVTKLAEGVLDDDMFGQASRGLKEEKTRLRAQLSQAESALANRTQREAWVRQVQEAILDFPLCWKHLNLDERRQVFKVLIEKLAVDRDGRDAIVKLKLHLLPERELRLAFQSTRQMKDRPLGVHALTRRQMVYLHYIGQGMSPAEIARQMGVSVFCIYSWALLVRKHLGIQDLQQAYLMARQRIESQLDNLPMGPTSQGKIHAGPVPVLGESLLLVLRPLAQGASTKEVAQLTGLTVDAVSARRGRILDALQAKTIYEAAKKARELGLLGEDE